MSFISVAAGQPIRATHVQQFTNWLTGLKLDTPGTVACTSTTEYALTVRSQDGGTGLALNVLYGASGSPSTIATFNKSHITLAVPVRVTGTTPMAFAQMAAPASGPAAGFTSLYAKTDGTLAYKAGTSTTENVVLTGTGGTYLTNPLTTTGDMIYSSNATTAARLAKGTALQALIMSNAATGPEWAASLQSLLTTQGDMVYASAGNFPARLAKGTAYQELVMNGGATAPTWASGPLALVQTSGDLVAGSAANAMTRVAAGTATQVLIGGTTPAFGAVTTAMLATNAVTQILFVGNALTEDVSPSTTSATYSTINQMTCAFTSAGGDIVVWAEGDFTVSSAAKACYFGFSFDGATSVTAERSFQQDSSSVYAKMYNQHRFTGVTAGSHSVAWQWKTTSPATLSNSIRQRSMMVMEVKR